MRVPDLDLLAKAAEVASKAIADLPRRDPRAIVVRRYLWAVSRVRVLMTRSTANKRAKKVKLADRQKTRAEGWADQVEELRPLVEVVMAGGSVEAPEDTPPLFDEDEGE